MGILGRRTIILSAAAMAGCYAPDVRDCTVTCSSPGDCAGDQVCGSDGYCAAPAIAGRCDEARDAPEGDPDADVVDAGIADARPDARPDAATRLRIVIGGRGKVAVSPLGVECVAVDNGGADCVFNTAPGADLDLLASEVHQHWMWDRWTSGCSGSDPLCAISTTTGGGATLVGARFVRED